MNTNKRLPKTLLSTSIAAALALLSSSAIAQEDATAIKTYTDPISGELKVAPQLLSEMTDEEKAELTDEERRDLEVIEATIAKEKEMVE